MRHHHYASLNRRGSRPGCCGSPGVPLASGVPVLPANARSEMPSPASYRAQSAGWWCCDGCVSSTINSSQLFGALSGLAPRRLGIQHQDFRLGHHAAGDLQTALVAVKAELLAPAVGVVRAGNTLKPGRGAIERFALERGEGWRLQPGRKTPVSAADAVPPAGFQSPSFRGTDACWNVRTTPMRAICWPAALPDAGHAA